MNTEIVGVELKILQSHYDDRGFFQEVLKTTDNIFDQFGQLSHSFMYSTDVIKAWHLHNIQTDYWWVPNGVIKAVLWDMREDSESQGKLDEFYLGENRPSTVLKIPPGVAHGLKVLVAPASLVYVTSHPYNPEDELRFPHDYKNKYDWLARPKIT